VCILRGLFILPDPRFCILVPHFDHVEQFVVFLPALIENGLPLIIVDDGSAEDQFAQLQRATQGVANLILDRIAPNQGKGAAVMRGAEIAAEHGYSHFVQVDADGQHDVAGVHALLAAARAAPGDMISGLPQFSADVPPARLYGRKISLWWARIETLSLQIHDAMCGYRVYPVKTFNAICSAASVSRGMQFDTEIMVHFYWSGSDIRFVPVDVRYPAEGRSHFRLLRDNIRISTMHARLFCGMLWRFPMLLARNARRQRENQIGKFNESGR